jgi:ABC-type nitrate/sulfonate/bicarbonate transport system substrate-binding protein
MLTKRCAVMVLVATMLGMGGTAYAQETKLNLIVFQGMQNLPLFAAQAKGFFAKRGLSVAINITPGSDEFRDGLAAGRYQIAHGAVDNAVTMAEVAKQDVAVVMGGDNSFNHIFVQPDIHSIGDLRGKTVIVDALATGYAFQLYEILRKNGLRKGDYTVKTVGATFRRFEAMGTNKDYKASMLNPPFSILAAKAGFNDMGSAVKIIGPYQATGATVMRTWAAQNSKTLVTYLQAYIEGLRWALDPKNRDEATMLLEKGLKLPPDVAAACYASAADRDEGLAKDAKFDMEGFKNVLKLRADWTGATPGAPEKYIDLSYYQKALAGL